MFAVKSRVDVFVRIVIIASVLFNAVVPTAAFALDGSSADLEGNGAEEMTQPNSIAEQKALYFNPPAFPQLQGTSPEGDEPVSRIPPKDPVEFTLIADPAIIPPDGLVTFTVSIRNNTEGELVRLIFTDILESGILYSPSSTSPVTFDPNTNQVQLSIDSLDVEEEFSFSYILAITSLRRNQIDEQIWLHSVELQSAESDVQLRTTAAIGVDLPELGADAEIAPLQIDGGWNVLDQVEIYMEEGAVGEFAAIVASPAEVSGPGPELQFNLDVFETDTLATDLLGEFSEQTVGLEQAYEGVFNEPAFLEINLDTYVDLQNIPAGQEPYVATYDEAREIWVKVPILETDYEKNSVTVEAAHFSTWGAGLGSSLPQNGANVLLFDQPYTSLFTGSSRYSIPVWTPPGRAGLQPDISLSYSSGTVDGVLGDVQAPWVGVGWNMDAVEIVRKITSDENGYGYRNEFALTLNGSLYQLVRDEVQQNRYYTDQAAFLYIERHNYVFDNTASTANTTGEWWEVVTTDGTRYRLGWNDDSEQLALMYGYACTMDGLDCITPDGAYSSLGYAGNAKDLVAMRWRVDRVSDTHGNYIEYKYSETPPDESTTIAPFDRESYLEWIKYTGFEDPDGIAQPLEPGYQIFFDRAARSTVGDVPTEYNIWDNLDAQLLTQIRIVCLACGTTPSQAAVRKYEFGYSLASSPNANGTLTLTSLKITGGGYSENGQTIPAASAPTIRFAYQDKPNRASGNGDVFNYPRLGTIDNGSGGLLTFSYENDNRANTSWYNYRVQNVVVDGGMGTVKKQAYSYANPVYSGQGGNPLLGSLIGYTTVTESILDFESAAVPTPSLSDVRHTFGTVGLDIGRELRTEWMNGSTVLRKSTSTYVTDNSQAPFVGWNYRYLGESASYENSGGVLTLTSRNTYYNDPATGNLLVQGTYLGSSLYRKTYYEYLVNPDPAFYILDKPSRVLLVDGSNQIYSDTRYHYDGRIHEYPTRGDVTLVQRLTGNDIQTVDSWTDYDIYGNPTSSRAYQTYGTVNTPPSAAYYESSTTYDANLYTLPVSATNALGNVTNSEYLYTLGILYRMTDPNTWITETTYDGLGRTLSVTPPGLSQPGTWFIYPSPDVATGRLPAPYSVEMQILDTIAGRYRSVWGIYDGAGRMLQTQVDAGSQLLVNTTLFNPQGLPKQQSLPYTVNGAGGNYTYNAGDQFTRTEYDSLGRATKVTAPGNIVSQSVYDGLTTTSIDPKGNRIVRKSDGLGRMIDVIEYSDPNTIYATTKYFYDNANRLVRVTDAKSNATTIQYDWLGRKTGMDDPDMGVWTYAYDPLGNMSTQTDARNQELTFTYDALNRLLTKNDEDPNTPATSYTYGSTPGVIGLRVGMSDPGGSTAWNYSDYGRTVTESRAIAGETHSLTSNSDWLGRAITTTYDDGEVISYSYDELGRPDQLKSDQTTLVDVAYNTLGQIATQALGNGTVITNTYDSSTNRLNQRQAVNNSVTQLDLSYTYDPNGNITRLVDGQLNETQFYQYDFLNRLTSAVGADGTPTLEPAIPENYGQRFEYDQVGNMLGMSQWGTPPTQLAYQEQTGMELAMQDQKNTEPETQFGQYQPAAYRLPAPVYQGSETETPTPTASATLSASFTPTAALASLTFTPNADATIQSGNPTKNYGSASTLQTISSTRKDFLIKFDVTGLSGYQITDVRLVLYNVDASDMGGNFYSTSVNTWLESTVKWNNAPAANATLLASLGSVQANTWYEVDLTSLVVGDGIYSLRVLSTSTDGADYSSKEGANPPQLVITYIDTTPSPATSTPTPTLTPAASSTGTNTPISSSTASQTPIYTFTATPKASKTPTATAIPSSTSTNTASATSTATKTIVPVNTSPGTSTPSATATSTPITYTPTKTSTPSNTPTVTSTGTSTPEMPQSLMAYWDFENITGTIVPDIAPNDSAANNAALVNGPLIQITGAQGSSVFFDGTNDYATVPDQAEIKKNGSFTVSAWVDPASLVTSRTQYILRKAISATNFDYGFTTTSNAGTATPTPPANVDANGKLVFTVGDLTPNKVVGPVLPINTWTLVTGVYDSAAGELRLYINGTLSAVERVTGNVSMETGALTLSGAAPNQFHGGLDEVRFYNRALSGPEVSQLFGGFGTPTPLPSVTPSPTSLATFTPTATALPLSMQQWGTGDDGSITINAGEAYNISASTSKIPGRNCVDAPAFAVTSLGSTYANISSSPVGCLSAGDEVMLINLQGVTTSSNYNAGAYEFLRVASVSVNSVVFTTMKTGWYGDGFHSDSNIGTGANQQHVMLMRVPNYDNVTINGTGILTGNAFDSTYKYGVVAFRVRGELTGTSINSTISMNSLGFPGAPAGGSALGYSAGGNAPYNGETLASGGGGGGGYASTGSTGDGELPGAGGNVIHGNLPLSQLFMGSGGGSSNLHWYRDGTEWYSHGRVAGGTGGGIVFISAQTINFPGSIVANGQPKPVGLNYPDNQLRGGGGAGGSIRIEGNAITLGTISANGGSFGEPGSGGRGRIALYYQTSYSAGTTDPVPYAALIGQPATPTPSPTPISFETPSSYGTGTDGSITVDSGDSYNINSSLPSKISGRNCVDAPAYNVVELLASSAKLSPAPLPGCLAAGDEILLIHLWGSGPNVGTSEYLQVGGVVGDTIYFKTPKVNFYGVNAGDDSNIGTGTNQQRVMLMRVPNYENVTINGTGTLTGNAFDSSSYKYGVLAFRVHGTLTGTTSNSTISMNSLGFSGAPSGGSALGYSAGGNAPWNGGTFASGGGGGGGHATAGSTGAGELPGNGGSVIYGIPQLSQLFMGSGGGASNLHWYKDCPTCQWYSHARVPGGTGGGIVFIAAQTINFPGSITANGQPKPVSPYEGNGLRGGGGAGGSIRIEGNAITLGTISANGGSSGEPGSGGRGRIAIYYANSLANSASICAQASTYCKNTSEISTPTPTGTAPTPTNTATPTPLPQGWYPNTYTYSTSIPHAVASVNRVNFTDAFEYDANGNMTCRTESGVTYLQTYNTENRIASISKLASGTCAEPGDYAAKWDFTYDGDGVRTGQLYTPYEDGQPQSSLVTRYFFGGAYETSSDGSWKKYYSFAGQTIAMKDSAGIQYFLSDHLGSILATLASDGTLIHQQRYLPFGAVRTDVGSISETDFGYTGQRMLDSGMGGIMDYKARFYSPYIMQFQQPDTIIPELYNPQSLNRYSYAFNNPIAYADPTGHARECGTQAGTSCAGVGPLLPTLVEDQQGISVSEKLDMDRDDVVNGVNNAWEVTTTVYSVIFEPIDWLTSAYYCLSGECSAWMLAGFLPFIPSSAGKHGDDIVDLYRAMDRAELDDIRDIKAFRPKPGNASMDAKGFWLTSKGAQGHAKYWGLTDIVKVQVPRSTLEYASDMWKNLDGFGPAVMFIDEGLDYFNQTIVSISHIWSK